MDNYFLEYDEYIMELSYIEQTILLNDFCFFITIRDSRPESNYKKFRSTGEFGYEYRKKTLERVLGKFRIAYGIRNKRSKNLNDEYIAFAVSETGIGTDHIVSPDHAHLHVCLGFTKDSPFYNRPTKHFVRFREFLEEMTHLDICLYYKKSTRSKKIKDLEKVASYCSKIEKGTINGKPFFKRPLLYGPVAQPEKNKIREAFEDKKNKIKKTFVSRHIATQRKQRNSFEADEGASNEFYDLTKSTQKEAQWIDEKFDSLLEKFYPSSSKKIIIL